METKVCVDYQGPLEMVHQECVFLELLVTRVTLEIEAMMVCLACLGDEASQVHLEVQDNQDLLAHRVLMDRKERKEKVACQVCQGWRVVLDPVVAMVPKENLASRGSLVAPSQDHLAEMVSLVEMVILDQRERRV